MADETKIDAVRVKVAQETDRAREHLAAFYIGRECPLFGKECIGPACAWWMNSHEMQNGKITVTGGGCAVPLLASQAGPIAAGLEAAAQAMFDQSGQKTTILAPTGGTPR